mmetsp:Transcript_149364/g.479676  ORF Transcript_149364/g.479676 Transcript_149364/m.479676 type:complete len:210 (-) Transcript_149364:1351-1980(-)
MGNQDRGNVAGFSLACVARGPRLPMALGGAAGAEGHPDPHRAQVAGNHERVRHADLRAAARDVAGRGAARHACDCCRSGGDPAGAICPQLGRRGRCDRPAARQRGAAEALPRYGHAARPAPSTGASEVSAKREQERQGAGVAQEGKGGYRSDVLELCAPNLPRISEDRPKLESIWELLPWRASREERLRAQAGQWCIRSRLQSRPPRQR